MESEVKIADLQEIRFRALQSIVLNQYYHIWKAAKGMSQKFCASFESCCALGTVDR